VYKKIILILIISSSLVSSDMVPFENEGYTSTYAAQNLTHKSYNKTIGKYNIYVSYDILARWKTEFLLGELVLYADYIYKIKEVSIYVSDTSSPYALMGASTSVKLKMVPFIHRDEANFLKSLVRISGLKIKVKFDADDGDLEFSIDGGVAAKNYDGDKPIYISNVSMYFYKDAKAIYASIDSKYKSYNTKGSSSWEELFPCKFCSDPKKRAIKIAKQLGYFSSLIEDEKIDYSNLISYVEQNILLKKQIKKEIKSSLMLLIDASGSMSGSKFTAAKSAAISNAQKAVARGVEVSVVFFGGDCSASNVLHVHDFTQDTNSLISFIQNAQTMGGTPLSLALKQANEYLYAHKSKSSKSETILLLGDGEGNCGNINSVISELKANNTFAHHETIGLEVGNNPNASSQLTNIAVQSGGNYHTSNSVEELDRVFEDAADIEEIGEMVGVFGHVNNQINSIPVDSGMQSILNGFE
jgi:Mg-chelatase subunit ChlD